MKDIMLRITGKTVNEALDKEEQEDVVEFVTEGKLYSREGAMMISYPESELSGLDGWTTYLTIKDDKVKLKRGSGGDPAHTVMEFESGKRFEGQYETPYGPIALELLTNSISPFTEDEAGNSKLSIDYSVSLRGLMETRNKLDIEILRG